MSLGLFPRKLTRPSIPRGGVQSPTLASRLLAPGPPAMSSATAPFLKAEIAPVIYHLAFNAAFALLYMNAEVATRFISPLPAIYWFAASLRNPQYVWVYFILYNVIGFVVFPTFYAWT